MGWAALGEGGEGRTDQIVQRSERRVSSWSAMVVCIYLLSGLKEEAEGSDFILGKLLLIDKRSCCLDFQADMYLDTPITQLQKIYHFSTYGLKSISNEKVVLG